MNNTDKIKELKPCPFCGGDAELPSGDGTQYEIECDCGMSMSSVQISDLMTFKERDGDKFICNRYEEKYIERAKNEAISQWNTRPPVDPDQVLMPVEPTDEVREAAISQYDHTGDFCEWFDDMYQAMIKSIKG